MSKLILSASMALLLLVVAACGGTKMLREPQPLSLEQPLAAVSDRQLAVELDGVIFRGGPGSWAKNVDWDEYLISVRNIGNETIQITGIRVIDSLGTRIEPGLNRRQLVSGTRDTKRRYKGEGLKVKAGVNGGVLVGAGVAAAAGTSGIGAAAMAGGATAASAAAVVVMVPVFVVGGVVRGVNNGRVNDQIGVRQTLMPIVIREAEVLNPHIFFPLSPSPLQIELSYVSSAGNHTLILDTRVAMEGLHLMNATRVTSAAPAAAPDTLRPL